MAAFAVFKKHTFIITLFQYVGVLYSKLISIRTVDIIKLWKNLHNLYVCKPRISVKHNYRIINLKLNRNKKINNLMRNKMKLKSVGFFVLVDFSQARRGTKPNKVIQYFVGSHCVE